MQQYPKLHIHLRVNNSDSVINDIKHNRVDMEYCRKGNSRQCNKM